MVDVLVSTSYGYRIHAVKKWATDNEDPLSTAISDFPKRGILVRRLGFLKYCNFTSLYSGASFPLGLGMWSVASL